MKRAPRLFVFTKASGFPPLDFSNYALVLWYLCNPISSTLLVSFVRDVIYAPTCSVYFTPTVCGLCSHGALCQHFTLDHVYHVSELFSSCWFFVFWISFLIFLQTDTRHFHSLVLRREQGGGDLVVSCSREDKVTSHGEPATSYPTPNEKEFPEERISCFSWNMLSCTVAQRTLSVHRMTQDVKELNRRSLPPISMFYFFFL